MVHLVPNVHTLAGHAVGAICLAPTATFHFDAVHETKYLISHWIFFLAKIGLEITLYMMVLNRMDPELFIYQLFKFSSIRSLASVQFN